MPALQALPSSCVMMLRVSVILKDQWQQGIVGRLSKHRMLINGAIAHAELVIPKWLGLAVLRARAVPHPKVPWRQKP